MSKREAIRMADHEVEAYLAAHARARVSTLDRNGSPHVVPITYVILDGSLAFWGDRGSQKVVNLRRDPRVACIIDDGVDFPELRGVELIGEAELHDDPASAARVTELFLSKVPEEWREMAREQLTELAAARVVVVVSAARVISWDHTKVPGLRAQDVGR
jgi:PPOX class probable F420-dependent enzyme